MECLITGLADEFSFLLLRFWTYTIHVLEYDKLIIKVLLVPPKNLIQPHLDRSNVIRRNSNPCSSAGQ